MGQPISPLMDRTKGGVTKSQTGFFNIVAMPMYTVSVCWCWTASLTCVPD